MSTYPTLPTNRLSENPRNRRLISPQNYKLLKEKLQLKRQYKPLLVTPTDEEVEPTQYMVLAGNHRLKAYKELGVQELWVSILEFSQQEDGLWHVFRDGEEEAERFQTKDDAILDWALTDNEEFAENDWDAFVNDMDGYHLDWSRYLMSETKQRTVADRLKEFLMGEDVIEDEAPAISDEPAVSQLGEVYQLGRHRLMCGDSTKTEDVEKLMNGQKADMVFTDPPYGISVVQGGSDGASGETHFGTVGGGKIAKVHQYTEIIGDGTTEAAKDAYNLCVSQEITKLIFWGGNYFTDFLTPSPCWLIWNKKNTGNFADVEMAWTNFKTGAKLYDFLWNGLSREGDRASELVSRVHPTQKPVGLHVNILKDYSNENEKILDLFGGSGTTLIACEQTNRTCYMMELDPKYCDVIRKRYARFIGQEEGWQEITPAV